MASCLSLMRGSSHAVPADPCKIASVKDEWMYELKAEYDQILGQTTGLLFQRGDEEAVALLVDVRSMALADTDEVIRTEKVFDPWAPTGDDGPAYRTVYRRAAVLDVDEHLVPRFTKRPASGSQHWVTSPSATARRMSPTQAEAALPEVDDDWRTAYAARLASDARTTRPAANRRCRAPGRGRADVRQRRGTPGIPGPQAPTGSLPGARHHRYRAAPRCSPALGNTWSPMSW